MGFLSGLLKRGAAKSAAEQLRERADGSPDDPRLQQDVAMQLKAAGDLAGAVEYSRRAAKAHKKAGFAQRALAALKTAVAWGEPTAELLQETADLFLELKLKEDARGALLQLRRLYAASSDKAALARVDAKIAELGPGR